MTPMRDEAGTLSPSPRGAPRSAGLRELAKSARIRRALPLPWDAAMAPGEWNGNHNDRAFLMVGVPAYPFCASNRADL